MAERILFSLGAELIKKIVTLVADEVTLARKFQKKLKNLEDSLIMVSALIHDASSNNKAQLESVKVWLKELNALAFDIDIVLEDLAYENLRYKIENRKRDKLRAVFSPSKNRYVFRLKMAHRIKKVRKSVDDLYKRGIGIGLLHRELVAPGVIVNTDFYNERLTHPFIDDDSKIVGREKDVENVVKMLCNDDDLKLSVIAIVGLGGQGKTTLAQLVCKDENVVKYFDTKLIIWVCVSENFVLTHILNEMVQFLTGKNLELSNVQAIISNELEPMLKDKRYLLVLDDVWNEDEAKWDKFRCALVGICGARGSKVMVTTRNDKVASTMQVKDKVSTHLLGKLSDEESWTMFKQRAFAQGGAPETDALTNIGKEIVKRCFGLPLAIKVIASLMFSEKSENDWLSVKNNQLWNIEDNTNRVLQTLKLSYDRLPFMLKRCFCFCSIYPKDKVLRKDELVQCWMALGLLQPPSGSNQVMEDLGERHFKTLLSMCLLQDTVKDEFGDIESCKMHDIVHDLALDTTETDYSTLNLVAQVYPENVNPQPHLRVLILNNFNMWESLSSEPNSQNNFSTWEYSIKKLKHLRYLDISWTDMRPDLSTCYNLHTIKITNISAVLEHTGKFINLRHICVDIPINYSDYLLTGIGRLTRLETLPFFGVNREQGCHIMELKSLNNLRGDLIIFGLNDVVNYEEAQHAFLSKKLNLRRLRLCWCLPSDFSTSKYRFIHNYNNDKVLEGLKPHSNLKGLSIENFAGSSFPQWMMVETQVLCNLVNLKLYKCDKCEKIPPLGHLQHLKVVRISLLSNVREIGVEFYGSSVGSAGVSLFPVLTKLVIGDMFKLERWVEAVPQSSVSKYIVFPCLEILAIRHCPNLESFPSQFPCLEKLHVQGCPNLKSFPSHFPSLIKLSIENIDSLVLKELSRMHNSLTHLNLRYCKGSEFQSFLEDFLTRNNGSLLKLYIADCDEFVFLPGNLVALEELRVFNCKNLTVIQHCLPSARTVNILGSTKFIGLPNISQLFPVVENFVITLNSSEIVALDIRSTRLKELKIWGLKRITSVTELCKSLRVLRIAKCGGLSSLPEELGETLRELSLCGCDALVSFPDFRYLQTLVLKYTYGSTEERRPSHLSLPFSSDFNCLEHFEFGGLPELKSLPDQIQHLTALKVLELFRLDGLESLPDWLGNLISLKVLNIMLCEKLKYFPSLESMRRLVNLSALKISSCPCLEERLTKENRPEWSKVSHISSIKLNSIPIND